MNPLRFLPLIVKSLARNRRRTLLMGAGIAVSVFVAAALSSVEAGFGALLDSSQDTLLNVREKGLACPVTSRILDSYLPTVARLPSVTASTGVLRGLYTYQDKQNLVLLSGVDWDAFRKMKDVRILEGSDQAFTARPDAALVGRPLAAQHGWRVGQTVSLLEDRFTFSVAGIFAAEDQGYETGVLVHKEYLAKVKRDEGKSTFFVVRVSDPAAVPAVSLAIDSEFANHPKPTKTQSERAARERELQDFAEIRRLLGLMVVAAVLVSIFGAANAVSMSVRERTREVGILRSLGLRREHVLGILVGESVLIAAAGGLLGAALTALALATDRTLGGMVPVTLHPRALVFALAVALTIGVGGAVLPAFRATRLSIVDALKLAD